MTESITTEHQIRWYGPRQYHEDGQTYRITAKVQYDDQCGNGRNSFAITADIDRRTGTRWVDYAGGCLHEEVAKHFPHLAPFLKWHGMTPSGPFHYLANAVYHASDRDCWGLRKGEQRQIVDGKTGKPSWILERTADLPKYATGDECPPDTATLRYVPWMKTGEGKERDLDAARSCAIWPDATDEDLREEGLGERLETRLPDLVAEFRVDVESLGFTY